jgi:hypothetical protein
MISNSEKVKAYLRLPTKSMLMPGLINCMNQFLDDGFPSPACG